MNKELKERIVTAAKKPTSPEERYSAMQSAFAEALKQSGAPEAVINPSIKAGR